MDLVFITVHSVIVSMTRLTRLTSTMREYR